MTVGLAKDMKKAIMVAPVGDNVQTIFVGIRDYPTEQVVLITPKKYEREALQVQKELEKFKIPARIVNIAGNIWEEMFKKIAEIKMQTNAELIVNTSTGDRVTQCAATSAAFVNGLKAISISDNQSMLLPVLKFSYYKLLTDKKIAILKLLFNGELSLSELAKKTRMSPPLINYHVYGNLKSEGLVMLGLVDLMEKEGKVFVELSLLGKLLVKGYVDQAKE